MEKYIKIHDIINQLTDDKIFKTFFVVYLMAETKEEREVLGNRFWKDVDKLPIDEQHLIKAEFTRCFLKLPKLVNQLYKKAKNTDLALA